VIALTREKYGISINEIYFASNPGDIESSATIVFFVQAAEQAGGMRPFKTSIVDLSPDENTLFNGLSSNTRYKIRRAEREGFLPEIFDIPSKEQIVWYVDYFDEFARQKKFSTCNFRKLNALNNQGSLAITRISGPDGAVLSAHAWVCDRKAGRVRLLYSASHFRQLVDSSDRNASGRANRFLHWYEMTRFKALGYLHYDLGGLPIDESDPERNSIARFKLEFGGKEVIEYTGAVATNRLGKIVLALREKSA